MRKARAWGGLLFGYFLLATQEKVTRSPEASEKPAWMPRSAGACSSQTVFELPFVPSCNKIRQSTQSIQQPQHTLNPSTLTRAQTVKLLIPLLMIAPLAACSWGIKLDSAGSKVRVAWNDDVSACRNLGKITVSVLGKVGPMNRSQVKINDELEVMARNEAAGMQADTIKPLADAANGEQSWGAYVCGPAKMPAHSNVAKPVDGVETFPIKEN